MYSGYCFTHFFSFFFSPLHSFHSFILKCRFFQFFPLMNFFSCYDLFLAAGYSATKVECPKHECIQRTNHTCHTRRLVSMRVEELFAGLPFECVRITGNYSVCYSSRIGYNTILQWWSARVLHHKRTETFHETWSFASIRFLVRP